MHFQIQTFIKTVLKVLSVSLVLTSCGLRYTPPPSWEELRDERRTSLEQQLVSDFKQVNLKPTVLLYGEPVTVKPASFIKLDSLFNLKYLAQKSGRPTGDLDRQIEVQRGVVLSDSTELLYRETVWVLGNGQEKLNFLIIQTSQNNQYVLRDLKILETFEADKSDSVWAQMYFTEKPFLRSSMGYTEDERNFYGYMKNHALELTADQRYIFLKHVFQIMRIANEERSLSTDLILRRLAALRLAEEHPSLDKTNLTFFAEKVQIGDETNYEVTVLEKNAGTFKTVYRFDAFFFPIP